MPLTLPPVTAPPLIDVGGSFLNDVIPGIREAVDGVVFWDSVVHQPYTAVAGSGYAQFGGSWADGVTLKCQIRLAKSAESPDWNRLQEAHGKLLYPAVNEETIGRRDRVRLVSKFGTTLARSLTFDVVGEPVLDMLGMLVDIELVAGGVDDAP